GRRPAGPGRGAEASSGQPRRELEMRPAHGVLHDLLVALAAVAHAADLQVVADHGDGLKDVRDEAGEDDGAADLAGQLAVLDLFSPEAFALDAPALGVLHAIAGVAQVVAILDAGDDLRGLGLARPEEGVGHAGIRLALPALAAAVGAALVAQPMGAVVVG